MSDLALAIALIVFAFAFACLVLAPILYLKIRRTRHKLTKTVQACRLLEEELTDLRKYQGILDAEAEAERIRREATSQAQQTLADAHGVKAHTESEAGELLADARQKAKDMRERAQRTLEESAEQSKHIIEGAKNRAKEIAGEALAAKGKADQYEKAANAMKNIIKGYGDEYVIPSRSVLDDLAEQYSYQKAGGELKRSRRHTVVMIKNGLAAECDYVEKSRREYAIHFVLDAFNGKVDTTLSKVKHDNYGKLKQEVIDAFNLVNHNGAAFRNARIKQQYLEARLDELDWAVAVHQLRLQEREEQRRQLENQIADLQEKLNEAESKEQRALSLAQQTKRGHVYIISNIGSFGENTFKVGLTRRLIPADRVRELGDASVPFPFDIHAMIYSEDAPALEAELHNKFQEQRINKVNHRKEFFRFGIKEIRKTVDNLGVEARWTMLAEAQEYRESRAIGAAMKKGQAAQSVIASSGM